MKKSLWPVLVVVALVGFCAPTSSDTSLNSTPQVAQNAQTTTAQPSQSSPTQNSSVEDSAPIPSTQAAGGTSRVLIQLTELAIKGRAPKTGYDRDLFGSAWSDVDRNGCDTRNDILKRDITNPVFRIGTGNCVVETGDFFDPYTNSQFVFVKSNSGSTIEIDHIVSLSDAWQKGAQQWNSQTRKEFANDPLNLVATSRSANRQKSDSDAASWLPPNKSIRCAFIARQVAVKSAYQLWVTQAEYDAMFRILESCPEQPLANAGVLR